MYKLLIVDDNKLQIKSLLYYLDWKSFGIDEIKTAENGREGLEFYHDFKPDVIITDVVMPEMGGIELTRAIREIDHNVKFIYISCHEDFSYLKEALDNDVISYVLKPINPKDLERSVSKLLDKIEYEKEYISMSSLLKESMEAYRKNFFYKLIYSQYVDMDYFRQTTRNLEIDSYKNFVVAIFEPQNTQKRFIDIYNILHLTEPFLFEKTEGIAVVENEKYILALFMGKTYRENEFVSEVKQIAKQYRNKVKTDFGVDLNVGISYPHSELHDIKIMQEQAKCAAENNLLFGDGEVGEFDAEQKMASEVNIMEIKEALDALMNQYSEEKVKCFAGNFWGDDVVLNSYQAKILCIYMYSAFQIIFAERNFAEETNLNQIRDIWNSVNMSDTAENIKTHLFNALKATLAMVCINNESDKDYIVNCINEQINNNYKDINSIEQIAAGLYISASYARKIYKQSTGRTIFDALLIRRMEVAKRLLNDLDARTYEVAVAVGYKSKQHFIEVFKRYTGQLPKDYKSAERG